MFRNSQICQHCIFINWFNIFFFIQILSMTFTGLENQGIINIITITRSYWTLQLCTKFKVFWYTWLYNDVNDNNEILLPSAITELFGVKSFLQDFSCWIRLVSGRQCRSLERKIIFQFSVSPENPPWAQAEQKYTIQWFDFISTLHNRTKLITPVPDESYSKIKTCFLTIKKRFLW